MPEEKKPWEQGLQEEGSTDKKPWEQNFSEDTESIKKKTNSGTSPLILDSSGGGSQSNVDSQRFNFLTGQNDLPPLPAQEPVTPLPIQHNESDLLRAAGTTQETIPVDQENYSPEIQKTGLLKGNLTESFMRGVARLGNSILKTPAFAYDIASSITNRVLNKPLGIKDAPSSGEIAKSLEVEGGATADLDKAIDNSTKNFQEKYDKGVTEYFKNGEYSKGFEVLANAIAESAPTTISLMMGNAAGVSTAASVGAGGLVFGAEKMSQLEKENPDMTTEQKATIALANGLMEGAFEQFGLTKIGAITASVLKKEGVEAAKKVAEEGFKKSYGKILSRYLGTTAEEALSEAATQFSQNAIDKYGGAKPDLDLRDGVADAAIIGLGSGSVLGTPTSALEVARTKDAVKRASEIQEHKKVLEEQLQNPDVSEEVKPALSKRIKDLNQEDAAIAADEKKNFEMLPEDKKSEVDDLLKKSHEIATSATDETISTNAREIFKRDIDNIDEKITDIYDQAEKEREQAATEKGLVKGEKKSEPIDLSTEIEELPSATDQVNEDWLKSFDESIKPVEEIKTDSVTPEKAVIENKSPVSESQEVSAEAQSEPAGVKKEKPVQELVDEQEQLEAKKSDDTESVKKLNDDIEILKKFDKQDIASKKFKAVIERAFNMKEEGKISKPTYTKYRNIAQQVLGPKISLDAEQAKFKIETLKEEVKKKLLGEGYKKVLMSAPGFGPKQVADLIDLTALAAQKAIDAGFTVKEAVEKALNHIKSHPRYAKLIKEGHLDEKTFGKSVSDTFITPEDKATPVSKEEGKPESKVSGIKKALVSDEIIQGVDLEKISDKEMQGLAKKIIDSGEVKPEAIVNEVLKNPRALQPKEVVALIYYKTQLDNDLREAYEEKDNLIKESESTGSVDARLVDLEQKRENYDKVSVITAQQQSLAFRLRKGLRDSDFNLVEQIARYKATNKGEMPAEVEARLRELDKQYREAIEKISKLEKEAEENEIEKAHKGIIEDIGREKNVEKNKTATQKAKELADKVRKLKKDKPPLKFKLGSGEEIDLNPESQGLSMNALIELAARTIETTGKVIDGINAVIKEIKSQEWYKKLSSDDQQTINQQIRDYFGDEEKGLAQPFINEDGVLVIPHFLIREIYKSGITDINSIVKAIRDKIDIPDVTDRQIRDAITRYGKTVNLNKDEVEAGIRQAKRIGKLISQLEDIKKDQRPKRSGLQRDKPSDEERRLMKEVKREMKNLPEDPEEDARALKSALNATKTRLRNRIADLENQLATGEKTSKSKDVKLDAEAKELKEKVEKLRVELESIEGKPKISDGQRLARMKTYAQNRIKELEAKIKNKDFSKTEKPKQISDTELTKARAELVEKRDEWEKLQYENELKNRSKAQKFGHLMLGLVNVPRAFKLGFDLSAVGVQGLRRLTTSPKQSAKAFKDMMNQVFSEKNQKEWHKNLKAQDFYAVLKASGAAFTETDGKISVREENFSNDLVKLLFKKVFNEKLGLDKFNPYEASNRAFSGYLNSIRLQGYLEGMKMLERKGKTFESHPQDYKSWVKYINNVTGRGSLGKKGNSSELAQFIFTSPRKMISEANLINPHFWGNVIMKDEGKDYDYQLTPTVARMALGDFALGLGVTAVITTLARAAFADDDDKNDKDFTDPRSSNFMGLKIRDEHGGFTVIHPFASYKTEFVLLSRLLSGKMANTRTGKVSSLGKQPMTKGTDLIVSFLSNKLSPTVQAAIWKPLKEGNKYDFKTEALKTIEPATLEGLLQTHKDFPVETEAVLTALAFFGLSETHIEKKKR